MGLRAVDVGNFQPNANQSLSLMMDTPLEAPDDGKAIQTGVVSWSPPTQNWNPWTGCNIDDGPLAHVLYSCFTDSTFD